MLCSNQRVQWKAVEPGVNNSGRRPRLAEVPPAGVFTRRGGKHSPSSQLPRDSSLKRERERERAPIFRALVAQPHGLPNTAVRDTISTSSSPLFALRGAAATTMSGLTESDSAQLQAQLRHAIVACNERCLYQSSKWSVANFLCAVLSSLTMVAQGGRASQFFRVNRPNLWLRYGC